MFCVIYDLAVIAIVIMNVQKKCLTLVAEWKNNTRIKVLSFNVCQGMWGKGLGRTVCNNFVQL